MVAINTALLQGAPSLKQCKKPSPQRAPVSRRRVVALAAPSTKHRPQSDQREEHNSSSAYVDASRTAEAVRSFDDAAESRGPSLQSASNLVRMAASAMFKCNALGVLSPIYITLCNAFGLLNRS